MAAPITTITFDDGLYHPNTPAAAVSAATATATPISIAPVSQDVADLATPTSAASSTAGPISNPATLSASSMKSTVTASSISSMASGASITLIKYQKPPNQHTPVLAVGVTVALVVALFGIIFLYGYFTSRRFRVWKERHWSRYPENKWKVTKGRPTSIMGESSQRESIAGLIAGQNSNQFEYPFQRQSRLQTFFHFGRNSSAGPVEEIDEERGWLWGTKPAKDNLTRFTTPGLGVGKYRAKSYGSHTSRGFKYVVGRSVDVPELTPHDSQAASMVIGESHYSEKAEIEETQEELLYDYAHHASNVFNYDQYNSNQGISGELSNSSSGISYLLTRLKDSISGRTKFSSLGSSNSRVRQDSSRGRWNEVGRLVDDDDETDVEDHDEKLMVLEEAPASHHAPLKQELSLADIALPSLPAFTLDAHTTIKIAKTKRPREPTVSGTDYPREATQQPTQHSLRDAPGPTRALAPKGRKLPPIPPTSADRNLGSSSSSRKPSHGTQKSRSARTASSSSRQNRRGTSGPSGSKKLKKPSAKPANEIFPGGYVGRSPTKKLRRKASPEY
ncbi:hypothetical protein PCASD_02875 [Puccinia coronata f. sp. avenae]|uniref:Uncharacterized protein n=1 Tax=Puccinia coronata f. sp. avenae TaxID=200324 RepID=A0A2N5VEI5_9BASI|nr:hypothetical protein PCASD_02875 [Puccinia coronata f. sp. avenae]